MIPTPRLGKWLMDIPAMALCILAFEGLARQTADLGPWRWAILIPVALFWAAAFHWLVESWAAYSRAHNAAFGDRTHDDCC